MTEEIGVVLINPFAGRKNLTFCQGKGSNDPKCLEKNPAPGKKMISGHWCGGGCVKFGTCQAVFASPEEHPDLFEPLL